MVRFQVFLMLVATTAMSLAGCGGGSTSKLEQQVAELEQQVAELEQQLKESEAARVAIAQRNPFKEMKKMENDVARLAEVEQDLLALRTENEKLIEQVKEMAGDDGDKTLQLEQQVADLTDQLKDLEKAKDRIAEEMRLAKGELTIAKSEIKRLEAEASAEPKPIGVIGKSDSGAEIISIKRFDALNTDYIDKMVRFEKVERYGPFFDGYKKQLPGVKIGSSAGGFITTVNRSTYDQWLEFDIEQRGELADVRCFAFKSMFAESLIELGNDNAFNIEGLVIRLEGSQKICVIVSHIEPIK